MKAGSKSEPGKAPKFGRFKAKEPKTVKPAPKAHLPKKV